MTKLTTIEKIRFWSRYVGIMLLFAAMYLLGVSGLTGFMVLINILSLITCLFFDILFFIGWEYMLMGFVPIFPIAYFLRYVVKVKKNPLWWFLNDTKDGDFGSDKWKRDHGIPLEKKNFWIAIRWYQRNNNWNFKTKVITPKWDGSPDKMLYLKSTVENPKYDIDWPNKDKEKFGELETYYIVEGTLYGRYGFAQEKGLIKELQLGAAGNRYKFRLKF